MWFPGYEKYYNENLSPRVTNGLGRSIVAQASLAVLHPGLYQTYNGDIATPSLLIRPRLQTHAKHSMSDIPAQVTQAASGGTGGEKRRWRI